MLDESGLGFVSSCWIAYRKPGSYGFPYRSDTAHSSIAESHRSVADQSETRRRIKIGDAVQIAKGAQTLNGVCIGDSSIMGAGQWSGAMYPSSQL